MSPRWGSPFGQIQEASPRDQLFGLESSAWGSLRRIVRSRLFLARFSLCLTFANTLLALGRNKGRPHSAQPISGWGGPQCPPLWPLGGTPAPLKKRPTPLPFFHFE